MAGGPTSQGGGIKADIAGNTFAGVLMVSNVLSMFAAFGGILYGYDTGVINGVQAMHDWLCTFGNSTTCTITTLQQSLVVSVLSIGTFLGALLGAPVADIIGRKWGVVLSTLVFDVGVAMQTASTGLGLFIAGRVIAGLGVGLISVLVIMYQSECAPKNLRGAIVSGYQWAITIGLLLAAIVNNATKNRPDHSSYRIPIAIQFIWAAILAAGMTFLPESPRYCVKNNNEEGAAVSLSRLLGLTPDDPIVQEEINDIRVNLEEEKLMGASGYLDCFKPGEPNKILFRVCTGIALQAWQQLTGINFIFYFGTIFFESAGISNAFLISVATNVVNVGMTLPGIYGVERFGRRKLLIYGAIGMCVCEFIVAIVGVSLPTSNVHGQKVLVAFVCIYIAFFASTWGPIAWVVVGEIFPLNVRAKAMSLSSASNWLWNWAISFATPYLVNSGKGDAGLHVKVFFIWGSTCFCCIIFAYLCVPETKGLSLEQVDILYQHSWPINSRQLRDRLIAEDVHASDSHKIAMITGQQHMDASASSKEDHLDEKV
ncbi:general substrate transporter [Schizopora paradoxa]|uniref:General substrate transporter n=1 Tax=Schizopora paradoxa TaxID=27342 RepID=A0A0H2SLJ7_9AGAM|nr:general substrate transporter [Schizopora paradoxa]